MDNISNAFRKLKFYPNLQRGPLVERSSGSTCFTCEHLVDNRAVNRNNLFIIGRNEESKHGLNISKH